MRLKIIVVLILLILSKVCIAQIYSVYNYTTENSLASRSVYDVTQDSAGIMWFATGAGVSSYDGFKFTNFNFMKDVFFVTFRKIKTDETGSVWCIPTYTKDSIRVFKNNEWVNFPPPPLSTLNYETTSFDLYYENDKPVLCLGTVNGIFINSDNIWKSFNKESGLLSNEVLSICTHDKKFYISTRNGLSVFNSGLIDNSINKIISKKPESILKVYFQRGKDGTIDKDSKMWVLQYNKIGFIENDSFKVLTKDFVIPNSSGYEAFSMVIDKNDNVYFGSGWTKYHISLNSRTVDRLFKENGFIADGCTSIFLDREDNLWVSDTRGLLKLNTLAFRTHNSSNGLKEDEVTAINEISPGKYIFGHNHGITITENYSLEYIPLNSYKNYKQSASRILDLHKDNNGNIWIAAYKMGIGRMDKSGKIEWMKTPDSSGISSVISDDKGNIFTSSNKGIYILKNGVFEEYYKELTTRKLFNLKDGKIWAATPTGVVILENRNFKNIHVKNNPRASNVFSILKDHKNRIFVGALDGLYILQNDSLLKYRDNNFSVGDAVYAMVQDKNNNFWIGTSKNLIFWDGDKTIRLYNSKNGLVPGEINRSALFFDSSDRLWIGTDMGASRYFHELDNVKNSIPKVVIKGVIENRGNLLPLNDDLNFGYKNNNLMFVFRAISFVDENSLKYKVKLEGYDKDWVDYNQLNLDEVIYRDLAPGEYVFKVKAKNFSSDWSEVVTSKTITIERPYYYKWWFILLSIIIAAISLLGLYVYRTKKLYLAKLEKEVKKRTEELTIAKDDLIVAKDNLEERVKLRTKELSESENKFRSVFEQASEGIVIYDIESRKLIQANKAYNKMLGYEKDEMLSLTLYDIVAHDKESVDKFVDKIDKEKLVYIGERFHKRKDGTLISVEASVNKFSYAGKSSMCVVVRDITERKKIEQVLFDSEKRFRDLVELLPEPVFETNPEGKIVFTNNAGFKLFGYTKEDFKKGVSVFDLIATEEIKKANKYFCNILNGVLSKGNEYKVLKKDGSTISIYINSVPIVENGEKVGIIGIAIDITNQKSIEEKLLKISEDQKELIAVKDKFFSIIAHDLRGPFTGLLGFTELLKNEVTTLNEDEIVKFSDHINKSARNVFDLLTNLLHWGRMQTGKIEIKLERINLADRVNTSIKLLKDNSDKKEILIENNISEELFIKADSFMIDSIMQNLLANAIKFTPRKGRVKFSAERIEETIFISVSDNGVGISKDKLDLIFRIDKRTSTLGTENEPGTGLGVILCKEMVERQEGKFEIISEEGKGTTVRFGLKSI